MTFVLALSASSGNPGRPVWSARSRWPAAPTRSNPQATERRAGSGLVFKQWRRHKEDELFAPATDSISTSRVTLVAAMRRLQSIVRPFGRRSQHRTGEPFSAPSGGPVGCCENYEQMRGRGDKRDGRLSSRCAPTDFHQAAPSAAALFSSVSLDDDSPAARLSFHLAAALSRRPAHSRSGAKQNGTDG